MKTIWIVIIAVVAIAILWYAYNELVKKPSATKGTSFSIDCSKYWSLNSIDKQWCKSQGLAPTVSIYQPAPPVSEEPVLTERKYSIK